MNDLMDFALKLIGTNPNIAQGGVTNEMIQAIQNGDNQKGETIANNLCRMHGMSKEEAIAQARRFFNI